MNKALILLLISLAVGSCDSFEYSPNQIFDREAPRNLNATNLEKLNRIPLNDDTVTIAFVGDSQRFYDEAEDFVTKINEFPAIDFVLLAGDITDFGLLSEYKAVHEAFSSLEFPYFAVIGNHDVIANGDEAFARMYGPLNYSFVYDSIKFVVHNTNSREYPLQNVPDVDWLRKELETETNSAIKHFIAVSHVPPTDVDFNPSLVEPYSALFASTPGFLVSLHGHIHDHVDHYPFNDGVRYITSFAFSQRSFVILKFINGNIIKEIIEY